MNSADPTASPTPPPTPKWQFALVGLLALVLVGFGIWMYSVRDQLAAPSAEPAGDAVEGGSGGDVRAEFACTHFRNVMADVRAGVYTDAELRTKLQEVYDDAKESTVSGIAANAEQMLRGITEGDQEVLSSGVSEFDASCTAAGL